MTAKECEYCILEDVLEDPSLLARLTEGERVLVVALDGKTDIVVMQIREYQRALEAMDTLDTIRGIREASMT